MAIDRIAPAVSPTAGSHATSVRAAGSSSEMDFGSALKGVLNAVDGSTADANQAVAKMIDGSGDVHEAMIALQRADTMLQLTVQIRNKIVQAYQDVMRMPV